MVSYRTVVCLALVSVVAIEADVQVEQCKGGKRQAIWRETRGLVNKKTSSVTTAETSDDSEEIGTGRRGLKRKLSQRPLQDEKLDQDQNLEEELKINGDIITIAKYQGVESSSILETAWKATRSLRKRYLMTVSTSQYLKKFPLLRLERVGPHLINIDFTNLNYNISPSALYTGLRQISDLIENRASAKQTLSKPLRAQQQRIHDLPKDTESSSLSFVGGRTGVRTKASRIDAAIRFILVAKTRSEGEAHLQEFRKEALNKSAPGIGVQPLVIAIVRPLPTLQDDVKITPCPKLPCRLKKNTSTHVSLKFVPEHNLKDITNEVTADLGINIPLPFIGVDGLSVCEKLETEDGQKASCPLKAGVTYVYKDSFPVHSYYPSLSQLQIHWALKNGDKIVTCFEVPAKIVG